MDVKNQNYLNRIMQILCFIFTVLAYVPGSVIGEPTHETTEHLIPKSLESLLISFDFQGGQTRRTNNAPRLLITSDGTIFLNSPYEKSKPIKTQISQHEIQAILQFAIDQNNFFDFDPSAVKKAVMTSAKNSGRIFAVADAPTTLIRIKTDGKDHTVEYYALAYSAKHYPDIKELQQLLAIQDRLNQLISDIRSCKKQ